MLQIVINILLSIIINKKNKVELLNNKINKLLGGAYSDLKIKYLERWSVNL